MNGRAILLLTTVTLCSIWVQFQLVSGMNASEESLELSTDRIGFPSLLKKELEIHTDPQLEKKFLHMKERMGFSGTVLVAEGDEIIHAGAYGSTHAKRTDQLDLNTCFQLASVSKIITAVAVLQLYDAGEIRDLNEEVQTYMPDFPYEGITIKHMLIHRSGMPRYMPIAEKRWNRDIPFSNEDMLQLMATDSQKPYFSPGNGFNYLNTNYAMLALLVERISGQSFASYLQQYIFKPAGMENSFLANPGKTMGDNVATGHVRRRRGYMPLRLEFLDGVVGDKGVYSSVIDLFRFDCALDDGKLIEASTLEEAFCPGSPNRLYTNYGLGWRMRKQVDQVVYHFGWWRGYRSAYIKDVTHDRTILVLSNHDDMRRYFSPWDLLCDYYEAK